MVSLHNLVIVQNHGAVHFKRMTCMMYGEQERGKENEKERGPSGENGLVGC